MTAPSRRIPGEAVAEGVGRIPGFVNCYTVISGGETYLIDTGFSRKAGSIVRAFQDAQVPLDRLTKILLTHHHVDHMGGAAYLTHNTPATLACHADDAPFVEGRAKMPVSPFMRLFMRVRPTPVASALKDGDRVGPLLVVHVPGHTPGEVAFYDPGQKLLFSGDSVVENRGRLTLPAPRFATNLEQAIRSLERLRALDVKTLLPGHGTPVVKNVGPLLDDLIRRAPTDFLPRPPP